MKKIVVMTGTRAEYGLLSPIIKRLEKEKEFETRLLVTGSHLSSEFGMTINEIVEDGVQIDKKIEILMSSDSSVGVSKAMGLAIISAAEYFEDEKPNALMVLGDRYECLAICIAALNARVPIIHIHGGEATEGLIDEAIRNSITKMSYLHFASTEEYRKRIIQMGESPDRVFNVGAIGVENANKINLLTKKELEYQLGCRLNKYAIMTFHPVTLEDMTAKLQADTLMSSLVEFPDITFICTKANADMNGRIINECIEQYAKKYPNIKCYSSLGLKKYLSAVQRSEFVIGNSSSGIIEVPSFKVPTINIGDRQKGRIQSKSVINCEANKKEIVESINKALSLDFKEYVKSTKNPYEKSNTTENIVNITKEYLLNDRLNVKKRFFDIGEN